MNAMIPSSQHPQQPEEVHLQDYLNVILRRRRLFIGTFIAVFVGVALYTFLMKPVYEASATLHVKDEKSKTGILGELALSEVSPIDSEIEILKSRSDAEKVVQQLHLDWQVTKKSKGLTFKLLDFSSKAQKPNYRVELTASNAFKVYDDGDNIIGYGKEGVLMSGRNMSLLLGELHGNPGDSFELNLLSFNRTVRNLREAIKVQEVGKKTNIIQISYMDTDVVRARDVVNTLVQAYLDKTVELKSQEASRTVAFVGEQLKGVRDELDKAEQNLQQYKSSAQVVNLDMEAQALITKLSDAEKARAEVAIQRKQMEFALASLNGAIRKGVAYSPAAMMNDPLVATMAGRLAELEVQKRGLVAEYTREHPAVKTLQGQIDELLLKVRATYETAIKNLAKQDLDIAKRLADYEVLLKRLPANERDLARFMRPVKVNGDIYTFLLQKCEEARIAQASTLSNIDIVDPAIIADKPAKPKKAKYLIIGLMAGCLLGVGLVFFREYLDDTLKDAESIKRVLGIPLLGFVPHIPHEEGFNDGPSPSLVTYHAPKAAPSEAFRSLRTALHFSGAGRANQCILVTSSFPGEGKSTISTNLAIIQGQTGDRVVLVGCDLRRPTLHHMFRSERSPGLSEVLAGDIDLDGVVRSADGMGIDYISAGVLPPNPAELLGSERMGGVIAALRERYDHIIIDAPPVMSVTDAQVLAPIADLVMVVIEAGRVPRKAAQHLRELLLATSAQIAGAVVNDRTGRSSEYYSYYGYYGYGSYEDKAANRQLPWLQKMLQKR